MSEHRNSEGDDSAQARLVSAITVAINRARHEDNVTGVDIFGCLDAVRFNYTAELIARDTRPNDDGEQWKSKQRG